MNTNTTIANPKVPGLPPNGSLFPYLATNGVWNTLPNNATDPLVSLYQYPGGRGELSFEVGNGNYSLALPIVAMLLQPNATIVPVWCVYALSGQYDHLPRALFYLTLIVAVLFRRSKWVSSAALGSAMAYSALTCVHLFVLLARFGWGKLDDRGAGWNANDGRPFGDIDFFGIVPVLSASGVMLAPILTWSTTFRTHEARPVVVAWGLLIFVSLVPALAFLRGFITDDWTLDVPPSLAYCTSAAPRCTWENLASDKTLTFELYYACGCTDFCGVLSPTAPLRSIQNMAVDLERQISTRAHLKGRYKHFFMVVMVVWVIATAQGLLSLLWSHAHPEQVRNFLFQLFYYDRRGLAKSFTRDARRQRLLSRYPTRRVSLPSSSYSRPAAPAPRPPPGVLARTRVGVASTLAATAYLFMVTSAVLYPICFIATIVVNELLAANYPVSETWDSVGAWSPWAAAALVLLSALVVRYSAWIEAVFWGIGRWPVDRLRYDRSDRPGRGGAVHRRAASAASMIVDGAAATAEGRKSGAEARKAEEAAVRAEEPAVRAEGDIDLNTGHIASIVRDVTRIRVVARERWAEFREWWADPLTESRRDRFEAEGVDGLDLELQRPPPLPQQQQQQQQEQAQQGEWRAMTAAGAEGEAKHVETEWRPIADPPAEGEAGQPRAQEVPFADA
jgi:hypothetical protein